MASLSSRLASCHVTAQRLELLRPPSVPVAVLAKRNNVLTVSFKDGFVVRTSRHGSSTNASLSQRTEAATIADENTSRSEAAWQAFQGRVGGEWDGYGADFTAQGQPLELPRAVVPDAFREWGVEIHDWQTQCPTLAHPEQGRLWYKLIRLLPTVGCEADAATTYSVEECDVQQTAAILAFHQEGSYTAVWRGQRVTKQQQGPGKLVVREGGGLEVEQCLLHGQTRVRVVQQLSEGRRIMVYRELWEGPFRNGESLGGCASGASTFAKEPPLQESLLAGAWHVDHFSTQPPSSSDVSVQGKCASCELIFVGSEDMERQLPDDLVLLPKDMWTRVILSETDGYHIETGWLLHPDQAIVSVCHCASSGELKGGRMRFEQRITTR